MAIIETFGMSAKEAAKSLRRIGLAGIKIGDLVPPEEAVGRLTAGFVSRATDTGRWTQGTHYSAEPKSVSPKVEIGARYTRAHVMRRDSLAGTYEELNPPLDGANEALLQSALIGQGSPVEHVTGIKGRIYNFLSRGAA